MDKNPAAETQSGSQMKNKKGLGCLSLMPALFVPLIVITWAVVASFEAGCVDENPLPILLAAILTLVLLHRLTRRFRSRGYNLRAIIYWFFLYFVVGVSARTFLRDCYQELSMGTATNLLRYEMNECVSRRHKKKDLDAYIRRRNKKLTRYSKTTYMAGITRGYTFNAGPKCTYIRASSSDKYLASFSILYDKETNKLSRTCTAAGAARRYLAFPPQVNSDFCYADKDLTIKQKPGKPGYW